MNVKTVLLPAALAASTMLALTGCASVNAPSVEDAVTSSPTATSEATTAAPVGVSAIAAEYPAPQNAPIDAQLAWEALLGPEGEYAAAASYQAVLATYGNVEPYATIYQQELRHISALIRQLDRYGISVPENPYLGNIPAPADLETAARAWADGEVANVAMYDGLIAQATDVRLASVLSNLRNASLTSHLPLFEEAAANGGTLPA
ncbi:MAG: hypothetical protein ACKOXM_04120 [Agromyces sp.]